MIQTFLKHIFRWFIICSPLLFSSCSCSLHKRPEALKPIGYKKAVLSTSQPLATQVGLEVLKEGGNAIDAAIAVSAVLGVVEPTGSGIGGDLFALYYEKKSGKVYALNGSGRSPKKMTRDFLSRFNARDIPTFGPYSITVPGSVDAWDQLLKRFGSQKLSRLLLPAIDIAESGFKVTRHNSHLWQQDMKRKRHFKNFAKYFSIRGRAPNEGETFKNPRLAQTLKVIAEKGRDEFYKGDLARKMIAHLNQADAPFSIEDFANHSSEWVEPINTDYKGYKVYQLPPNTQGVSVLRMLNVLESVDPSMFRSDSSEWIDLITRIKIKTDDDIGMLIGDPKFYSFPKNKILSKEDARKSYESLNFVKTKADSKDSADNSEDTTAFSIRDEHGNVASIIQSNSNKMGSGITPDDLGFVFHNRGASFLWQPGLPNSYAAGKRPFHTTIPTIVVKNSEPVLSFGVRGGMMQPQAQVQVLNRIIDFGQNLQEATNQPRFRHEYGRDGERLLLEDHPKYSGQIEKDLKKRGYNIIRTKRRLGSLHGIWKDEKSGLFYGAADRREDGKALGY